jgi:hypothetical protein
MLLYHVTDLATAKVIMKEGFAGGWGDAGFGIYFFDNEDDALDYGDRGGWDGSLKNYAILEVHDDRFKAEHVRPDPAWPNPEDYETVLWVAPDPDDSNMRWRPSRAIIGTAARLKKPVKKRTRGTRARKARR